MCTMTGPAAPADTGQALAMVRAGLGYLARCDAGSLATEAQAAALTGLEHAEAQHTAARAKILSVFTAQHGYEADGQYGAAAWLRAITRITRHAAGAATGWARRLGGHPVIAAALAAGQLPASLARLICDATDQLPDEYRDDADGILLAAVLGGADQDDLARLAREMIERARTGPDRGDDDGFEERAVWLGTTFGGAGRLQGDLTPGCAAALTVVLDALGQKAGPEDTRTAAQRRHDAIEEACARLIAGQRIPGRDGQPPHLIVHVDLNDLRGPSVAERSWTPAMAAAGPGSVYLTGAAAAAAACDAVLTTVVTGRIDWQALDQLTGLWLTLHAPGNSDSDGQAPSDSQDPAGSQAPGDGGGQPSSHSPGNADRHGGGQATGDSDGQAHGDDSGGGQAIPRGPLPAETRARLQATLLQACLDVVSGPGGVASYLRGALLNAPFSSLSQPLDIGRTTRTIPPHLRTAVILRDQHCQFPGCRQPASACEVHHLIHWAHGGPTSLGNLGLYCRFHHLIVIHRWGWAITRHPDGTRTATAPDGRTLHSHSPPQQVA